MAKKTEEFDDTISLPEQTEVRSAHRSDMELEPLVWAVEEERIDPKGTAVKAEALVGKEFDLVKIRKYESSFKEQDHAYFCVCKLVEDGSLVNTTLGGAALIDAIDAYIALGVLNPMRVTLTEKIGGAYGRYYIFT